MGRCTRTLTRLLAVAAVAACAPAGEELTAGRAFPGEWDPEARQEHGAAGAGATFIAWVFRTEDCLSCDSFDYAVRRSQAALPEAVPLVAVHVGSPSAEQVARSFFAGRRIRVDRYVTVSPHRFRRLAGPSALPAVVLVREGRVAWTSALPEGVSTPAEFEALLRAFHDSAHHDGP
jgi:hypothetical protein